MKMGEKQIMDTITSATSTSTSNNHQEQNQGDNNNNANPQATFESPSTSTTTSSHKSNSGSSTPFSSGLSGAHNHQDGEEHINNSTTKNVILSNEVSNNEKNNNNNLAATAENSLSGNNTNLGVLINNNSSNSNSALGENNKKRRGYTHNPYKPIAKNSSSSFNSSNTSRSTPVAHQRSPNNGTNNIKYNSSFRRNSNNDDDDVVENQHQNQNNNNHHEMDGDDVPLIGFQEPTPNFAIATTNQYHQSINNEGVARGLLSASIASSSSSTISSSDRRSNEYQQQQQQQQEQQEEVNTKKNIAAHLLINLPHQVQQGVNFPHSEKGTLHVGLINSGVSFIPYPTAAIEFPTNGGETSPAAAATSSSSSPQVRLFIGQLPYRVTEMQLQWMFFLFGGPQAHIREPERITKKSKTVGYARVPTGCVHCHIAQDQVARVIAAMSKRLLVDDSGIWYASNDAEKQALDRYTNFLKQNPEHRFADRPYDSVVVQEAVSSYQSAQPRWVSNCPEMEKFVATLPNNNNHHHHQQHQHQQQQQHINIIPKSPLMPNARGVTSANSFNSYPSTATSYPNTPSNNNNHHQHHHHRYSNNNNNNNFSNTHQHQFALSSTNSNINFSGSNSFINPLSPVGATETPAHLNAQNLMHHQQQQQHQQHHHHNNNNNYHHYNNNYQQQQSYHPHHNNVTISGAQQW